MITPLFTFDERLLNGSDYTQSSWVKTNVTITPNATTAPDGTNTAQKIQATTSAVTQLVQTINGVGKLSGNGFSLYIKQGSGAAVANTFNIRNSTTSAFVSFQFNYSTGVVTGAPAGTVTVSALPNNWWRFLVIGTPGMFNDGDNIQCNIGFAGGLATAGDFLFAWGGSLRSILLPTYPAVGKPLMSQRNVIRHDSVTSSGIKQSIVERREVFFPLTFTFSPAVDMTGWDNFMAWSLDGNFFSYYPDSTDLLTSTVYSLEDTSWLPKRAAFQQGTFSINMRVFV